jgi:hypothetical protein
MCPIHLHSAREDHSLSRVLCVQSICTLHEKTTLYQEFFVSNPSALCTRRPLSIKSSLCPIHLHSAREDHSLSEFYVSNPSALCTRRPLSVRVPCVQSICTLHEKTTPCQEFYMSNPSALCTRRPLSLTANPFKAYLVHSSKCIQKPLFRKVIEII